MHSLLSADPDIVLWWGSRVECVATITRLVRERELNANEEAIARARLDGVIETAREVEASEELRDRAERLLAAHAVRAGDALQLGAALVWARERPRRRGFVCLDGRLREAARREGFDILSPTVGDSRRSRR
jgi:hypothetical protein